MKNSTQRPVKKLREAFSLAAIDNKPSAAIVRVAQRKRVRQRRAPNTCAAGEAPRPTHGSPFKVCLPVLHCVRATCGVVHQSKLGKVIKPHFKNLQKPL